MAEVGEMAQQLTALAAGLGFDSIIHTAAQHYL